MANPTVAAPVPGGGLGLLLGVAGLVGCAILAGFGLAVGELSAMVVALTVVGAVATLVDYRVGAVLMMVMLPLEGSAYFPGNLFGITGANPMNLVLAATLGSFILRGRLRGFMPRPLLWLYVVPIVIAGLVGMRHVEDIPPYFYENEAIHYFNAFGYLRDELIKPMFMVLATMLIAAAVRSSQKPERFLVPILVAIWISALIAIGYVVASGVRVGALASPAARGFFSEIGMHANDLGRLYAVAYALALFTWGETKDYALKTVLLATMGIITIALLLTFSRGAFVGFAVINGLYVLWKMNSKTLVMGAAVAVAVLALMPEFILRRVMLGFDGGGDINTVSAGRIDGIWLPLLPELLRSPLWGNGLDSTMWADAMWAEQMLPVTHPHSAYLQALLDMGLIGTVLLLAFWWHVWKRLRALGSNAWLSPTMRGFFQGAAAGLVCFAISGWAGSSLRPAPEFAFLWVAVGVMYGVLARKPAD